MAIPAWRNQCRTTTICVDSYEDGVPKGRFYNLHLDQWVPFRSLIDLLKGMERSLDEMAFPRAFNATRSFAPAAPQPTLQADESTPKGKLATFAVRILFRQNTSWQGSVTWMEGRTEESFRSVLELILLMDSALTGERAE